MEVVDVDDVEVEVATEGGGEPLKTSFVACRGLRSTRRAEISKVMRRSLHYRLRVLEASIEICRVACSQKCTVSAPYGSKLCETL